MRGGLFQLFWGRGGDFQELGHHPLFWSLMVSLGTGTVPLGVSFSLLMCYNECTLRIKISLKLTRPSSWTSLGCVLGPCHSFKSCALPSSQWVSGEALQIAVKRREVKSKGEKERYKHLNAEFQRIARRDKKNFLSDQCKEIEENNRMVKTRDLFKKIRDTKGTFHAKMGSIKDRNGMDLTEAGYAATT